jgi:hypothetical protein
MAEAFALLGSSSTTATMSQQLSTATLTRIAESELDDIAYEEARLEALYNLTDIMSPIEGDTNTRSQCDALYDKFNSILDAQGKQELYDAANQGLAQWNKANAVYLKCNNEALAIFQAFFDESLIPKIRVFLNLYEFQNAIRMVNKELFKYVDDNALIRKIDSITNYEVKAYSVSTLLNEIRNHLIDFCVIKFLTIKADSVHVANRDKLPLDWYDISMDAVIANVDSNFSKTELRNKFSDLGDAAILIETTIKFDTLRKTFDRHPFNGFHNEIVKFFDNEKNGIFEKGFDRCEKLIEYFMDAHTRWMSMAPLTKATSSTTSSTSKTPNVTAPENNTDSYAKGNNKRPSESSNKNESGNNNNNNSNKRRRQQQAYNAAGYPSNSPPPHYQNYGGGYNNYPPYPPPPMANYGWSGQPGGYYPPPNQGWGPVNPQANYGSNAPPGQGPPRGNPNTKGKSNTAQPANTGSTTSAANTNAGGATQAGQQRTTYPECPLCIQAGVPAQFANRHPPGVHDPVRAARVVVKLHNNNKNNNNN